MMKKNSRKMGNILPIAFALILVSGCSTLKPGNTGEELAASGPTVVDVRVNPETIELNKSLQPTSQAEVLAEVKDFTSPIKNVKLRFTRVPLEIPMQHIGGTTWRAV